MDWLKGKSTGNHGTSHETWRQWIDIWYLGEGFTIFLMYNIYIYNITQYTIIE